MACRRNHGQGSLVGGLAEATRGGPGMRRFTQSLLFVATMLVVICAAAGCGAVHSAIANLTPSHSVTVSPTSGTNTPPTPTTSPSPTATVSASPTPTSSPTPSPTVTASPTVQPTTPSATATAQPTSSPTPTSGSGKTLIWLWILLGALVIIGVIALITHSVGRRSRAKASWRSGVIDAYAKGSALYDAMSVAETPAGLAADDAGARWYDIQRRADDLAQTLYALREAAPNQDGRDRVEDALTSLQAVRSAMAAERAPGGAGPQYADVVRDRMFAFEASIRALRSSDEPL
jgi:hypothetical protein